MLKIPKNRLRGEIIIHYGSIKSFAREVGMRYEDVCKILRGDIIPPHRVMYVWSHILNVTAKDLWETDELKDAEVYPIRTEIGMIYV
jgi:hypothetical protein